MGRLAFLLGAGFNADAAALAGEPSNNSYPLVRDLAKVCFNLPDPPASRSIEDLFQHEIEAKNRQPVQLLVERLMRADHYTGAKLAANQPNLYSRFLFRFAGAPILTFNYDALPELILLKQGTWNPKDGYGVPVHARVASYPKDPVIPDQSETRVYHLHGSLCVYGLDYAVVQQLGHSMDLVDCF